MPGRLVFVTIRARLPGDLTRPSLATPILAALQDTAAPYGVRLDAYCLMPDHIHLVVTLLAPDGNLAKWIRYAKRESGRRAGMPGLWQRSYWDRNARKTEDVVRMVRYVLENPVRRGLCAEWREWLYSWSRWQTDQAARGREQ